MKTMSKYNKSQIMKRAWNITSGKPNGPLSRLKTQRQRLYGSAMRGQSDASTTTRTPVSISISETDGKTIH